MRPVRSSVEPLPFSRVNRSLGNSGVRFFEQDFAFRAFGGLKVDVFDFE